MIDRAEYARQMIPLLQAKQSLQLNELLMKESNQLDSDDIDSLLQHLKFENNNLEPNEAIRDQILQILDITLIDTL